MKLNTKSIGTVFVGALVLACAGSAFAYPPDNAAVLYYKAFWLFTEPNDAVGSTLKDAAEGKLVVSESIRKYLDENRYALDCVETATEVEACDWGLDLSEGIQLIMPPFAKVRQVAYMFACDARLLMRGADYRGALEKCLRLHRMARHAGEETVLGGLICRSVNGLANECIADMLSEMPADAETLMWLKKQLAGAKQRVPSYRRALANELEAGSREISKGRYNILMDELLDANVLSEDEIAKFEQIRRQADEGFFARSREYYTDYWTSVFTAYELPYAQSHEKLNSLNKHIALLAAEKLDAFLPHQLAPQLTRVRTVEAESEALFNATIVAVEVYIIRARTGGLPDELRDGLPQDPFSNKDFLYERTADGFVLKCQGKDLDKDIAHEYAFKVK